MKKITRFFKRNVKKIGVSAAALSLSSAATVQTVLATNTYAKNGATWVLDGIFWLAIVLGIFGAAMAGIKRNFAVMLGIVVVTAIVCVLCGAPEILKTLGEEIKNILGL